MKKNNLMINGMDEIIFLLKKKNPTVYLTYLPTCSILKWFKKIKLIGLLMKEVEKKTSFFSQINIKEYFFLIPYHLNHI